MMTKEKRIPTLQLVLCAVFAALTAVCAQITIPIGAVPISLSLLPPLLISHHREGISIRGFFRLTEKNEVTDISLGMRVPSKSVQ